MKNPIFIKSISIILLSSVLLSYTPKPSHAEKSPITEIKKAFETPPDMLNETLKRVKNLEATATTTKPVNDNDLPSSSDPDAFRNPFIPQTPQAVTIIEDDTVRKPVEPMQRERPTIPIPTFILSGLVWNTKKPTAILNGKIVSIGDQINNWSISEITKQGVHVTFEGQNLWVRPIVDPNRSRLPQPVQGNYR